MICDWGDDNGIRWDCVRVGWREKSLDGRRKQSGGWIRGERKGWREEMRELFGNTMGQGLEDE